MQKNRIKQERYENDDVKLIKNLIIIFIIVSLLVVGLYFFTDKVVMKKEEEKINEVEFNYDNATVGTMLNRPYDEYMVLLYSTKESEATYYNTLLNNYAGDKKIYFVDLSLKTNERYVDEKSSGIFENLEHAKFSGPTLLKIKDGKVYSFLEGKEEIKTALS